MLFFSGSRIPSALLPASLRLRSAVDGGLKFIFYFSCTFIELCGIVSVGEAYSFISQEYASNKRIMRDISLTACKQAKEMFE